MDEPLGALDKKLREQMQIEIKRLQRALGVTVIYVTHDQEEALTMSDRVAVMDGGRLVQAGTPVELDEEPATPFVADFIGKMNFLDARCRVATADTIAVEVAGQVLEVPAARVRRRVRPGAALRVAVRPEQMALARPGEARGAAVPGTVETAIFVGAFQVCLVRIAGDVVLHVQLPAGAAGFRDGERVDVAFDPAARSYAWIVLLQRNGIVNTALREGGLITEPLRLIYTEGAVIMAMTHVLLPYMILPIYAALRGIPPELTRASRNLGAGPWRAFTSVTLPLSLPGVYAGCLIVFILALGFYVTPALVGGPRTLMIATLIGQQVGELLDWPFASALAAVLLALTIALVVVFRRFLAVSKGL